MNAYKKLFILFGLFLNITEIFSNRIDNFFNILNPICIFPVDSGLCTETFLRYYYNPYTNQCEEFIYTGCGGNENRFVTRGDCDRLCSYKSHGAMSDLDLLPLLPVDDQQAKCFLPADPGPCRAIKPRFYYDTNSRSCQKFNYGGCSGNENNFEMLEDCIKSCV